MSKYLGCKKSIGLLMKEMSGIFSNENTLQIALSFIIYQNISIA